MRSTFMGLETSKRGLYTQQSALYTTGHNISNANTLGYSRQRVNMQATSGFPGVGLNAGTMPGFLGTGVEAGSIQRIRDSFIDKQYRNESNQLGYWENRTKNISQMEDVLAEPSKYGLQGSLSEFWAALQTLANSPENGGARAVVVERGVAVADSFKYIDKSLKEIQDNIGQEIGVSVKDINSIMDQIAGLNKQIAEVEPNGYLPNDLYDARDALVDELSTYLPIEVKNVPTGGKALAIAEGTLTVKIKTKNGEITVIEGKDYAKMSVVGGDGEGKPASPSDMESFTFAVEGNASGGPLTVGNMQESGKLRSLVESFGYPDENGNVKGLYPDMLKKLDDMAKAFVEEFNKIHKTGEPLSGTKVNDFFQGNSASTIEVNAEIQKDPNKFNASSAAGEAGNGEIALQLSKFQFNKIEIGGIKDTTIQSFYSGVIGELGVEGQQAVKMTKNSMTLLGAVSSRRDSVSSVSLDEEMTDMIRFQQAYNASARMVTVMDETLDKIINGMGVVGR
ncbi:MULTISPECIES: flagellar hook-associated protein FlgK [unclassified Sporosarcina]|uniref:flagellar hook-associated protein FlgK n=1 Tax=unclassified Sporosarcina TaxID=2647733 RepID=UPI00203BDD52|nr:MULTISPECIES: flagellar hook-associated protein FlgK [unclassified Sporosarcina]GKV64868.1 flagellar hook-associated protein 1 [Sporosarcina sp. NCCP-2331]GLB54978.1 flagellar hook-associated protein 1 [Sporosarcina sp. NCCP-2378]